MNLRTLLAIVMSGAGTALAHPGHGTAGESFSWIHFFTEPDHLLMILAAIVVLVLVARSGARR
jgi:hydrogenase/urease accessory protein HupE